MCANMLVKLLLGIVLVSIQRVSSQRNCSTSASIKGGHVTYSQGGLEGSVLTYRCRPGQYPSPVSFRICKANGQWTPMRLSNGRTVTRATCKDVLCPAQVQLDNGHFWPRDEWIRVGGAQTFSCQEGFILHGSEERNCTITGEWTGSTPVCRVYADDCDDPGTPPGAHSQRFSGHFFVGDRVTYRCQSGLELLGSAQRVCLENREWSGSTPRCQSPYTFDSPSAVAAAMAGSLAGVMDVLSPISVKKAATFGRTFQVSEGSRMNVFVLLDTSGSITKEGFELSRKATIALITKLASYEVEIRFHVLSFATEVIVIADILSKYTSTKEDYVINQLQNFDPKGHGDKTGTNLYGALNHVSERLGVLKIQSPRFNETQNVIVIETDGHSNIGNKSSLALNMIRSIVGYNVTETDHTHERLLDVYVFGIGTKVKKDELNSLASKKRGENHLFILENYSQLGEVFNNIISDKTVTVCGVAQEHVQEASEFYTHPWHVNFLGNGTKPKCSGSIVSQDWVLMAAHCFGRTGSEAVPQIVEIRHGEGTVRSDRVIMHPKFNVDALKQRNVKEFYDYDLALVHLKQPITLSWKARPICLPCTVPANRAMKRVNSTCLQHMKELIPHAQTTVSFLYKSSERKETHIHTGSQRAACVDKAKQTLTVQTDVTLDEYVPDRFFCSGGSASKQDAISCKGDSGGSLFLQKRKRFFQVGVVSWGTTDLCSGGYEEDRPPPDARDFHIDLFQLMPWLKEHLGRDIEFLPDVQ